MRLKILSIVVGLLSSPQAFAGESMSCGTGPAARVFGGTNWLVYSCDNVALVFVSDSGNPAFPYTFFVYPSDTEKGAYVTEGEGTGSKQATAAALAEISRLSGPQITALIDETKRQKK